MKQNSDNFYWKLWLVTVLLLVLTKVVAGKRLDENSLFILFSSYIIPVWLWVMYLNYRKGHDLMSYLKENHRKKWEEITYIPFFGSGGINSFKSLPFVYSNDDLSDDNIKELKKSYRKLINFALVVFVSAIPLFLLVMVQWQR